MKAGPLVVAGALGVTAWVLLRPARAAEDPYFGAGVQSFGPDQGSQPTLGGSQPALESSPLVVNFPSVSSPFGESAAFSEPVMRSQEAPNSKKSSVGGGGGSYSSFKQPVTGPALSSKSIPIVNGKVANPLQTALVASGRLKPQTHLSTGGSGTTVYGQLYQMTQAESKKQRSTTLAPKPAPVPMPSPKNAFEKVGIGGKKKVV